MNQNINLENKTLDAINHLTHLDYHQHPSVLYEFRAIFLATFFLITIQMSNIQFLLFSPLYVFLIQDLLEYRLVDIEQLYFDSLPKEKKKNVLVMELIRKFFRCGAIYVEFTATENRDTVLNAKFYNVNDEKCSEANFHKNYNVIKGKKYTIHELIDPVKPKVKQKYLKKSANFIVSQTSSQMLQRRDN